MSSSKEPAKPHNKTKVITYKERKKEKKTLFDFQTMTKQNLVHFRMARKEKEKSTPVWAHIIDQTIYEPTCRDQGLKAWPHVLPLCLNNQVEVKQTVTERMFSKELRIQPRLISVH